MVCFSAGGWVKEKGTDYYSVTQTMLCDQRNPYTVATVLVLYVNFFMKGEYLAVIRMINLIMFVLKNVIK